MRVGIIQGNGLIEVRQAFREDSRNRVWDHEQQKVQPREMN